MPIKQLNETTNKEGLSPFPTRKPEVEKVVCDCGSTYFQEIVAQQFPRVHNIAVGMSMPPYDGITFNVMKCIRCGDVIIPQVIYGQQDVRSKKLDEFIDENARLDGSKKSLTGEAI